MTLYIHIPFCASKCGYCAFNSVDSHFDLQEEYVKALMLDLSSWIRGRELTSIYFGGGTPNLLDFKYYAWIFELIREKALVQDDCEITIECNPNLIRQDWCNFLKDLGVNRISLGVQSFFEEKLNFLQRDHRSYDIFRAIDVIRQSGITNISIDLIYNTPLDSLELLKLEIDKVQKLGISHLSAYALSLDKGSHFYKNPPPLSQIDYSFDVRKMLKNIGFTQYEVSSYYNDQKSRHNLSYWRGEDYIGCGAGATGCLDGVRYQGISAIPQYIKNPLRKHQEYLTEEQRQFERLFLGLRCEEGICIHNIDPQKVRILIENQKCKQIGDHLIALDFFLADEIAIWLS